jgi:hypothetical protein
MVSPVGDPSQLKLKESVMARVSLQVQDSKTTTVSYSLTSGSLPTGMSLNSSTGVISGTPSTTGYNVSGVTSTFDITATSSTGNATVKTFTITRFWNDGTTASRAAESGANVLSYNPSATAGYYYFKNSDNQVERLYYDSGYVLVASNNASEGIIDGSTNRYKPRYYLNRDGDNPLGIPDPNKDYIIGSFIDTFTFTSVRVFGFGWNSTNGSTSYTSPGTTIDCRWNLATTGFNRYLEVTPRASVTITGTGSLSSSAAYFVLDGIRADYAQGGFTANNNQTTIGGVGVQGATGDPTTGCYLGHGTDEGQYEGWYNSANTSANCQGYTTWVK